MAELRKRLDRVEQGATEIRAPADVSPFAAAARGMTDLEIEAALAALGPDQAQGLVTYGQVVATRDELITEGGALLRGMGL